MKIMTEESRGENSNLLFDLETLIETWDDMMQMHKKMAKLLKEQNGKTNCLENGYSLCFKKCIGDIKEIIEKSENGLYKDR